jgi:hypothetical protein
VQNIISAHASCARFFLKKKSARGKSCKKQVAHGTSLAIYNTEACTFRYDEHYDMTIDKINKF